MYPTQTDTRVFAQPQVDQTQSAVVSLPSELLLPTLRELLHSVEPLTYVPPDSTTWTSFTSVRYNHSLDGKANFSFTPAVLASCQTLYREAYPILYHQNELAINMVFSPKLNMWKGLENNAYWCYILGESLYMNMKREYWKSDLSLLNCDESAVIRIGDGPAIRAQLSDGDEFCDTALPGSLFLQLRNLVNRFENYDVVVHFERRPFQLEYEPPSAVELLVMEWPRRTSVVSHIGLLLQSIVESKSVNLTLFDTARVANPKDWRVEELASIRLWNCQKLRIFSSGLPPNVAQEIQDSVQQSNRQPRDLLMPYFRFIQILSPDRFFQDGMMTLGMRQLAKAALQTDVTTFEMISDTLRASLTKACDEWAEQQHRKLEKFIKTNKDAIQATKAQANNLSSLPRPNDASDKDGGLFQMKPWKYDDLFPTMP